MRVIRSILATAMLVVCAGALSAQSVGVMGGWSHPTFGGADAGSPSSMNTFAAGGFFSFPLTPMLGLEVDGLYAMKGAQDTESGVTGKMKLAYFEVPVLAKIMIPLQNTALRPSLFVGPYVGFKASCNFEASGSGTTASQSCSDLGAQIKSQDFGVTFGGGLSFPLGQKISGLVNARYDLGLSKIDDSTSPSDIKNRALMVLAGISIPLGGGKVESMRTH